MECHAVWISEMGYEKRIIKTGSLRKCEYGEDCMEKSVGLNTITNTGVLEIIVEERALIQTPRKRQRKWNQERDKENGTDRHRLLLYKYLYFISLYALVTSIFSYILSF